MIINSDFIYENQFYLTEIGLLLFFFGWRFFVKMHWIEGIFEFAVRTKLFEQFDFEYAPKIKEHNVGNNNKKTKPKTIVYINSTRENLFLSPRESNTQNMHTQNTKKRKKMKEKCSMWMILALSAISTVCRIVLIALKKKNIS